MIRSRFFAPTALILVACARHAPPPVAPTPVARPAHVEPPPFTPPVLNGPPPADEVEARRAPQRALRQQIFDAAWTTVRDKHYDRTLGGVDWKAARTRYEARALGAPDEPTFYRAMNEMLGELRQSHLAITGPGDGDEGDDPEHHRPASAGPPGDVGLVIRVVEDQPTITEVRPGSPAEQAGLRAGFRVTHIAGRPLKARPPTTRALRPVEERFYLRLGAAKALAGPAGTPVTLTALDFDDKPREVVLKRTPRTGQPVTVGNLPPLYPEVRARQIGDIGYVAFNFFLLQPVLAEVQKAIEGFRARAVRGLIIDLRGNPGGMGGMAIPVARAVIDKPITLGTMQLRDNVNTFTVAPAIGVKPYTGPLVILTDEGSASTSEILAAGLQEAKRAVIVGEITLGAVLPSAIEALPGGAVLQYVVADFKTPSGILLEGRGVLPDRRVVETRSALREGRDVALDAALAAVRASKR